MSLSVTLRSKPLVGKKGYESLYLDINHYGNRYPEFLNIHVRKTKQEPLDKEKWIIAREYRDKREIELLRADYGLPVKNLSKTDFVAWYTKYAAEKTNYPHHKFNLNYLKKYVDGKTLLFIHISRKWVIDYSNYLLTQVGSRTAFEYRKALYFAFKHVVNEKQIMDNPFDQIEKKDRIRYQKSKIYAYTLEELQLLIDTPCPIHEQIRQAWLFSCFTGLRWSDTNCFTWNQIVIRTIEGKEQYFMYFHQEKTEDLEYIPISDQAVEILNARKQASETEPPSPYIFPYVKETNEASKTKYNMVKRAIKKWAKAASLDPKQMNYHVSRHTFATNVQENCPEADLWLLSKLLGHKSIRATMILRD